MTLSGQPIVLTQLRPEWLNISPLLQGSDGEGARCLGFPLEQPQASVCRCTGGYQGKCEDRGNSEVTSVCGRSVDWRRHVLHFLRGSRVAGGFLSSRK